MSKRSTIPVGVATILLLLANCTTPKSKVKFEKQWETTGFETPECVIYDNANNVYYVSNIGGQQPDAKDSNGFISVLNSDGSIQNLKFVEDLNAPKGMGIYNGNLYVTDIDKIVKIDIAKAEITEEFPIESAVFLNDIAIDPNGILYITDSQSKTFFKLNDTSVIALLNDTILEFPNGIVFDNDKLISGVGNQIISINPETGSWTTLINETGGVDGLAKINEETFLISDWPGKVYLTYTSKDKELLLDTSLGEGGNTADFCLNKKENLVLIPTFFKNSVVCYKLNL